MTRSTGLNPATCAEIARDCTFFKVQKASRAIGGLYNDALRPTGLRGTQFSLLVGLSLAGSATVTELAHVLRLDRTSLTRNLRPLERAGLVVSGSEDDRRQRVLRLTERGRRTLAGAIPIWERVHRQVVRDLGKDRWTSLLAGLEGVINLSRT